MLVDIRKLDAIRIPVDQWIAEYSIQNEIERVNAAAALVADLGYQLEISAFGCWWSATAITEWEMQRALRIYLHHEEKRAAVYEGRIRGSRSTEAIDQHDAVVALLCRLLDSRCDIAQENVLGGDSWYGVDAPDSLNIWTEFCAYCWNDVACSIDREELTRLRG